MTATTHLNYTTYSYIFTTSTYLVDCDLLQLYFTNYVTYYYSPVFTAAAKQPNHHTYTQRKSPPSTYPNPTNYNQT